MKKENTYSKRGYSVTSTEQAKKIALNFLEKNALNEKQDLLFGLPEADDRYNIWRVPLIYHTKKVGEIVINAYNSNVDEEKSSKKNVILEVIKGTEHKKKIINKHKNIELSDLKNTIIVGDSSVSLNHLKDESVNLIFTSPPYFNAKPEYAEYTTYDEYLELMRKVIRASHRVLSEGRFFVINISPVLIRRASRNEASKRIAVPFDLHRIFIEEGYDFIDDIHWVKPEGAGWSLGRGRRFAADRNPLQYKPVPVTEYILVYRKKTDKLIDWNIRNHPNKEDVLNSKIPDGYETTNLWKINPSRSKKHPATFPLELAEKVIKYYSFINDVILDPFAGSGTTAKAARLLQRRFVMCELEKKYIEYIKAEATEAGDYELINDLI